MDKLIFLFAAFFLVWGLRLQSSPESAARGNKYAALGMFLSIFGSLFVGGSGRPLAAKVE